MRAVLGIGCALLLEICTLSAPVQAAQAYDYTPPAQPTDELTIYGAADTGAIRPIFEAFQKLHPSVAVHYREFSTQALYHNFLNHPDKPPDLMLSPAMDLQFKLVNDGYAQTYTSDQTAHLPDWAKWSDQIFGFTFEPIVTAINTDILAGEPLPESREQLLALIRKKDHLLDGKIGLSDIKSVGLGYLTWSYDSQQSRSYGQLLEAFSVHRARLYPNTTAMLKALTRGEIFIAYNVLGSYTRAWSKQHPWIVPVLPMDYTTVIMRTAFIPTAARHPTQAKTFLNFLLSPQGQKVVAERSGLTSIDDPSDSDNSAQMLRKTTRSLLKPIPLGLELLLQTDEAKRQILINEWDHSINPPTD